jgi:tetratricopeptide (TPR) repeat protein
LVALLGLSTVARADEKPGSAPHPAEASSADARARARDRFLEAKAAHERGEFEKAARLFEEAYRISPQAAVKFNAGISWDRGGDHGRAADAYEAALDMGGLQEQEAVEARERLGALKRELGYLSVDEPVGGVVSVAHVERATVPVRLHVMPGSYPVRVENGGRSVEQDVRVGAGEVVNVRLQFGEPPPAAAAVPATKPAAAPPATTPGERPAPHRSSAPTVWGWIGIGGGVALSGLAIFLGVQALDEKKTFDDSHHTDVGAHDRAAALRTWSNVAWGGAAVSGGTGLYLLFLTPPIEL